MAVKQPHIVVVGGGYAGISAVNSLLAFSDGNSPEGSSKGRGPPGGGRGGGAPGGPGRGGPLPPSPPSVSRVLNIKPRITLLDERDGWYHTVGAPLGQISSHHAREFWIKYDEIFNTRYAGTPAEYVRGSVSKVDTSSKTLTYSIPGTHSEGKLSYDFLILSTGIRRGWPIVPKSLEYETYVRDAEGFEKELDSSQTIVVVGGGACGIEYAGELKTHWPEKEIILLHSRNDVLSREPLTEEYKSIALRLLKEEGVNVILNTRLQSKDSVGNKTVLSLSNGKKLECDKVIFSAVQEGANSNFLPKNLLEDDGSIKVRETFQVIAAVPNADYHFAVGDVASAPGIKRSGRAQGSGTLAAANIINSLISLEDGKSLNDAQLRERPQPPAGMTISIGSQAIGMRMGLSYGKQVKERAFGYGLGFANTVRSLGLKSEEAPPLPVQEDMKLDGATIPKPAATAKL